MSRQLSDGSILSDMTFDMSGGPSREEIASEDYLETQETLLAAAEEVADEEAADLDALLADLKLAMDSLGQAYNRLARSTEPVRCVVQGRVETAIETVEAAFNLIKGLEQ